MLATLSGVTSEGFREWLRLWRRFYSRVFSLRYNFQLLLSQPLPSDEFCWPIVVGGRGEITLQKLCANHRPLPIVLDRGTDLKQVMSRKKRRKKQKSRLVSLRMPGPQPYVSWIRDPRNDEACFEANGSRSLWQDQISTTTLEEELLLRWFAAFFNEAMWLPTKQFLCAGSWVEEDSVKLPSGRFWPPIYRSVALIRSGPNLKAVLSAPNVPGVAREVFVP